ncbi:MAG: 3'(2'),5'-bisphosphate nucleotidase CysQ [Pyrinomonadaceae bacterium]|nr:3'(2'),5'-bisphosphate nucleotidase CysQ [Pyrinomonadaceae bacterium]
MENLLKSKLRFSVFCQSDVKFEAMLEKELETAIHLAQKASETILDIYEKGFEIETKFVNEYYSEPVTIADKTSSRIIVEGLAAVFPDDAILSEEEPDDTERRLRKSRVWIIDPLDGTKGFTEKQGDFAVQIGLCESGEPILGVVLQPIGSNLYYAVKNKGTFLKKGDLEPAKLYVSDKNKFEEMTLAVSRSHRSKNMNLLFEHFGFQDEFRHGSVGLKVGLLAQKAADLYIHLSPHTKFWDTAAPQIILEEAGGKLTDIFGEKIQYGLKDVRNHNGIFSSNGISHEIAVEHLRPLLVDFGRHKVLKARH